MRVHRPITNIEHPFVIPHPNPTSEALISANIGALNQAYASGHLDLNSFQTMLAGQHAHIAALKVRDEIPANTEIRITGGLPPLPGCSVTMPVLNGTASNGHEFKLLKPSQLNPSSMDGIRAETPHPHPVRWTPPPDTGGDP